MQTYVGNLTNDAKGRMINEKTHATNLQVALNRPVKKDGKWGEKTTYLNGLLFNSPNIIQHLKKGRLVEITGDTEADFWVGEDGVVHPTLKMVVKDIKLPNAPGKPTTNATGNTTAESVPEPSTSGSDEPADDLPF